MLDSDPDALENLGVARIDQFKWKQLLDLDACVNCGRCEEVCPAHLSGAALSPRKLIQDLKQQLHETGPALLARLRRSRTPNRRLPTCLRWSSVPRGVAWPRPCGGGDLGLPHLRCLPDGVPGLRRAHPHDHRHATQPGHDRIAHGRGDPAVPQEHRRPDASLGGHGARPRGLVRDLDIKVLGRGDTAEYLFWVGCTGALVDRNIKVTRAMVRVLQAAGVDFAVLGAEESCTGDPARRVGEELSLPDLRQDERRDTREIRRGKDHHDLSPLLQQLQERVSGFRRALRGRPPHPADRRPGSQRASPASRRAERRSPTTTPATSAATTRSTTSPARSSRASRSREAFREWTEAGPARCAAAPEGATRGWTMRPRSGSTTMRLEDVRSCGAKHGGGFVPLLHADVRRGPGRDGSRRRHPHRRHRRARGREPRGGRHEPQRCPT